MTHQGRLPGKKPLLFFLLLTLLFAVPFVAANVLFHQHRHPGHLLNHGQLIEPPFTLSQLPLKDGQGKPLNQQQLTAGGRWLMIYFHRGVCQATCRQGLYYLRQIRTAVGKNSTRIQRVLLTAGTNHQDTDNLLATHYRGTQHFTIDSTAYDKIISQQIKAPYALHTGTIYLVDPHGNVMMSYQPGAKASGIFKDLTRLLKVSQIG